MSRVEKGGRSFRPLARPKAGIAVKKSPSSSLPDRPDPSPKPTPPLAQHGDHQPSSSSSLSSSNQPIDHTHRSNPIETADPPHPQPVTITPSNLSADANQPINTPSSTLSKPSDSSGHPSPPIHPRSSSGHSDDPATTYHPSPPIIDPAQAHKPELTDLPSSTPQPTHHASTSSLPPNSTPPSNEISIQPSPSNPSTTPDPSQSSDHVLTPAEKMRLKAKAAKAARAAERLKNPSSSRRSTSLLSIPPTPQDQPTQPGDSTQTSDLTTTQLSSVQDIPVPDLSSVPDQVPAPVDTRPIPPKPSTQVRQPPIDPMLAIAEFLERTTATTTNPDGSIIPDILVSTNSSDLIPPGTLTQPSQNIIPSSDQSIKSKPSAQRARFNRQAAAKSKPELGRDLVDSEQDGISPRLKRKQHLEKLRKKKSKPSTDPPTQTHNDNDNQMAERTGFMNQKITKRTKRKLQDSSRSSRKVDQSQRKRSKRSPNHGSNGEGLEPGDSLKKLKEDESDSPLDPTEVLMAELSNPNRTKGQASEVLEKRNKLIVERRDREKSERMAAREERKKKARQVLIDRVRTVRSRRKERKQHGDPNSLEENQQSSEERVEEEEQESQRQPEGLDDNRPSNERERSTNITNDSQPTEVEKRKKIFEQYGLEDLDSEDDEGEFEEVIFDEFARSNNKNKRSDEASKQTRLSINQKTKDDHDHGEEEEEEVEEEIVDFNENDYAPQSTQYAPQLRVVNGQIVLDQDSLEVNRLDQSPELEDMEVVEESDSTRLVNSHTWSKSIRGERWSVDETGLFYDAIRLFGSDFEMIAQLFPGRTRRQIRLKWNKEEKRSPEEITNALMGKKKSSNKKDQNQKREARSGSESSTLQLAKISEEEEEEEEEEDGSDEEDGKELVIPTHLNTFKDYARIVGIDFSGPIPIDPMDKWREKERLEYLEEQQLKSQKGHKLNNDTNNNNNHDDDDDDDDDELVVEENFGGWGELEG